jgi:hypothetical protein
MEQILGEIRLHFTDEDLNEELKRAQPVESGYTRHYNQGEDFFVRLPETFRIPQIPVHHDVRKLRPEDEYLRRIRSFISRLCSIAPSIFADTTYLFDPSETLRPGFFHLYRIKDQTYLYLLRLDLSYRPQSYQITTRGTNDMTPEYETDQLFLEADLIPLDQVMVEEGRIRAFRIRQSISQTWIGETGRGYFVQGIWIDRELTKFFTRLFLPEGVRSYPYYPFSCKYRAICFSVIDPSPGGRKASLPVLYRATEFLTPHMGEIQEALRAEEFTEGLPSFKRLKEQLPAEWNEIFHGIRLKAYLNELDLKEYRVEHDGL